ncbi:DNA-processing protein DprA [Bacteroidota bacterium]
MNQLKLLQVAISLIPGIGNVMAKQLISYCGSAEEVFKANKRKLVKIPGIGEKTAEAVLRKETFNEAERIIKTCEQNNTRIFFYTDKEYPFRLKQVLDAPSIIFFKGNTDLNGKKIVSIVGTRSITQYGKETTEKLISDIKVYNPLIISGLAYGVDIHAHKTSLKYGLSTIAVLGGGIGRIYPSAHMGIVRQMYKSGGLISEYPYDMMAEAHFFPERNRIIAGMSDVVVIVEAAKKGGALITAEYANTYNREVFAIPGNLDHSFSQGCNHLIKTHKAHILTGVKDIEYIMNWEVGVDNDSMSYPDRDDLTDEEAMVIQTFMENGKELMIDDLSWKAQIPVNRIASLLLSLEFKGLIRSLPGKKFKLYT